MAAPTYAQSWAKIKARIAVVEKWIEHATDFVSTAQTYEDTAKAAGDLAADASAHLKDDRSAINAKLKGEGDDLYPLLLQLARSDDGPASGASDPQELIDDLVEFMVDNSQSVKRRNFTRGAFAAGSVTGDGVFRRCTVDQDGNPLESSFDEVISLEVEQDQTLGAPWAGRETWRLKGETFTDWLEWGARGSGMSATVQAVQADASLLGNPNFTQVPPGGIASPTSIPSWETSVDLAGNGTDVQVIQSDTDCFLEAKLDNGSPGYLAVFTDITFTQRLRGRGTRNVALRRGVPYCPTLRVNPALDAFVGAVTLGLGSKSVATALIGAACTASNTGTGNVDAGTHSYVVTFVYNGSESGYSPSSNVVTVAGGGQQVNLSNIPVGPTGTTARKIYRKVAGNTGNYKLLATIANNSTTTYADNTADSGLGSAITTSSHDAWVLIEFASADYDDLYLVNWNQADAAYYFTIDIISGVGTSLAISSAILTEFQEVRCPQTDGTSFFLVPIAGSTAWKLGDTGSITDTAAETGAEIQRHFHRSWGRSLPASGSPTMAYP